MEWWRVAIRVYLDTPDLIYASGVLGLLVLGLIGLAVRAGWKLRDQSALDNEKAMTTRLALAHDQQGILKKEVAELTQRVESYVKALRTAPATIHNEDEQQLFIASLLNQSATVTDSVKELGNTLDTPWTQLPHGMSAPKVTPLRGILDLDDDLKKPVSAPKVTPLRGILDLDDDDLKKPGTKGE
jgi:hypothetical protein